MKNETTVFAGNLWKIITASIATITTLIGGVVWLNSVHNTAVAALELSKENHAQIEKIKDDVWSVNVSLTEIRSDVKYIKEYILRLQGYKE